MLKKILLLTILIALNSSCDYSPVHLNKKNDININLISILGDKDINNYLSKEIKRQSTNSGDKIDLKINTIFEKKIIAKDTKSFATDFELKIVGNFELIKDDISKSFSIIEKFQYKNLNDNYEQNNYETMIKRNLAKSILSKLNLRIRNFNDKKILRN